MIELKWNGVRLQRQEPDCFVVSRPKAQTGLDDIDDYGNWTKLLFRGPNAQRVAFRLYSRAAHAAGKLATQRAFIAKERVGIA
jgi:hypothetical protein